MGSRTPDPLVVRARTRPWWQAVHALCSDGTSVVVHDPEAPEEYHNLYHSGLLTHHDSVTGEFLPGWGSVSIVRSKRPYTTLRLCPPRA